MEFSISAKFHISFVSFLVLLSVATSNSNPCEFPAIFNFGASNSDTGGFSAAFTALKLPFGETYFHRPAGRISDGRIILDFIGPLGCLSSFLTKFPSAQKDEYGCAKAYNEVAQYFNQQLKEALAQLRKEFLDAAITYVDIYSAKLSLFQDPKKYGNTINFKKKLNSGIVKDFTLPNVIILWENLTIEEKGLFGYRNS
ncbi:unnamed protein product [Lupinus luteus]|uniref:Uncharacterized protein n=1 Tax=Lupinus luteus TaxID=3873 RepID=A0AAV1X1P6_LUPLU